MEVTNGISDDELLYKPVPKQHETQYCRDADAYQSLDTYKLPSDQKHYQQQYADMYFARLAQLKPAVEKIAAAQFSRFEIAGEKARRVNRVLDVRQGELCWVVGTCYMDMPLKQNVLEDLGREHWIAAPPPREKYTNKNGEEKVMLEDESGRLNLTGLYVDTNFLVTGAIIAVIGTENRDGEFEVLAMQLPDMPRQPERWKTSEADAAARESPVLRSTKPSGGKIAIVSGLDINRHSGDTLILDLLQEYLTGEAASGKAQDNARGITRLIIAGNALTDANPIPLREEAPGNKTNKIKKYGYDSATYNAVPSDTLDAFLATILPTMPITILPGDSDPAATALPQPPLHMAYFTQSRAYAEAPGSTGISWFDSTTNPAEFNVAGHVFLATGGQPVDDALKYLTVYNRTEMMEMMLRWRLVAPTAPDTLFCYPFQDKDLFVINECPHVFIAGNQPRFETRVAHGPQGQKVRMIAVPKFRETGKVVLLDEDTLECEVFKVHLYEEEDGGWSSDSDDDDAANNDRNER